MPLPNDPDESDASDRDGSGQQDVGARFWQSVEQRKQREGLHNGVEGVSVQAGAAAKQGAAARRASKPGAGARVVQYSSGPPPPPVEDARQPSATLRERLKAVFQELADVVASPIDHVQGLEAAIESGEEGEVMCMLTPETFGSIDNMRCLRLVEKAIAFDMVSVLHTMMPVINSDILARLTASIATSQLPVSTTMAFVVRQSIQQHQKDVLKFFEMIASIDVAAIPFFPEDLQRFIDVIVRHATVYQSVDELRAPLVTRTLAGVLVERPPNLMDIVNRVEAHVEGEVAEPPPAAAADEVEEPVAPVAEPPKERKEEEAPPPLAKRKRKPAPPRYGEEPSSSDTEEESVCEMTANGERVRSPPSAKRVAKAAPRKHGTRSVSGKVKAGPILVSIEHVLEVCRVLPSGTMSSREIADLVREKYPKKFSGITGRDISPLLNGSEVGRKVVRSSGRSRKVTILWGLASRHS